MYDVYGLQPSNMDFSETTDFENYTNIGWFNEGVMKTVNFSNPKHGTITYLTEDEIYTVSKYWNVELEE